MSLAMFNAVQPRSSPKLARPFSRATLPFLSFLQSFNRVVHPCKIFSGRLIVHATGENDFPTRFYLSTCRAFGRLQGYRKECFRVRGHIKGVTQKSCQQRPFDSHSSFSKVKNLATSLLIICQK